MLNNRWFQLGASVIAMIMIANLQYAWTFFVSPLQAKTGWQLSDIQFAFTLFILFQTWVQPLDGWLIDRLGPRGFISAAGLLCGLGWAGMGYVTSLPMLYTAYCAAGIGAAFVYSASIGSALKWFKDRRGLASGIMAAGFGGGTALFIPIITRLIEQRGYQSTFVATGLAQGLVIVIVAQFLRHPASEPASAPKPAAAAASTQLGKRHFTTPEMLSTSQFYVLYAMFVFMATGGLLVTANAGPMAKSWGLSAAALKLAGTLSPLANAASRIFWGLVSDRVGRERTMIGAFFLQAICLFLVVAVGRWSETWFILTLVLVYFTWGEIYSLFPSISADYFGSRHATSNYGVLYTAKGVASIIGGWVGAKLFEAFGTWSVGFYGSAAMALVACAMAAGLHASISRRAPGAGPQVDGGRSR
ncbi:MAG TPA: oxalate/formate MFS antiporter [Vicinamibacterales bacterium]|nr:oxalate/formate MFS antiporter [Vicinamibacterales bacterium]